MTETTAQRRAGLAGLWPWPGNLFLMLFAAWLIYMGTMVQAQDLRQAFYGLGGVTAIVLLFGLRSAFHPSMRRRRAAGVGGGEAEDLDVPPRRSMIPDREAGVPIGETDRAAASRERARAELEQRMRREHPAPPPASPAAAPDAPVHPAVMARSAAPAPRPAESEPAEPELHLRPDAEREPAKATREPEVEAAEESKAEPRDAAAREDAAPPSPVTVPPPSAAGLSAESVLSVAGFEERWRTKLLPAVEQMIADRVRAATAPETLRHKLGVDLIASKGSGRAKAGAADAGLRQEFATLAEAVSAARADLESANAAAREERTLLREEFDRVRERADAAMKAASEATEGPGEVANALTELRQRQEDDRKALTELRTTIVAATDAADTTGGGEAPAASALRGLLAEMDERLARGLDEAKGLLAEARDEARSAAQRMAEFDGQLQTALRGLERRGAEPAQGETPADQQSVQAEVDALREALTTIIEQNREIRAQQETLSARFDPAKRPTGSR